MKVLIKPTRVQITGRVRKGAMSAGDVSVPYSRKNLETLAQTLKMHRALVWMDPATNSISIKHLNPANQHRPEWVQRD